MKVLMAGILLCAVVIAFNSFRIARLEQAVKRPFAMTYLRGYIDTLFVEHGKYTELLASAVIYHNFIMRREMPGKYAGMLDMFNTIISGVEGDSMLQYGEVDTVYVPVFVWRSLSMEEMK